MKRRLICVPLLLLLAPLSSSAAARPQAMIAGQIGDGPALLGPVQARRGEVVRLFAVLRVGARYFSDAPTLLLGSRRLDPSRLRPLAELGALAFSWVQVEPEPHHLRLSPPNPGNPAYSNAILFGKQHGRWLGYDRIEYSARLLEGERASSLLVAGVRPTHPKVDVHAGLGTMRYQVIITRAGQQHSSPGLEAIGPQGILPSVMRVSIRQGDDLVGWMAAYFNVPNVFGSGGDGRSHQTELFQGADCADVIIGAARLAGARQLAYTSVLGLRRHARPVSAPFLLEPGGIFALEAGGRGRKLTLTFGSEVQRGDILLIDYLGFDGSPRSWDHVAVIARDRGQAGVFDPEDTVLHMGYLFGLTEAEARSEGPARVQLLRFRPGLLRPR